MYSPRTDTLYICKRVNISSERVCHGNEFSSTSIVTHQQSYSLNSRPFEIKIASEELLPRTCALAKKRLVVHSSAPPPVLVASSFTNTGYSTRKRYHHNKTAAVAPTATTDHQPWPNSNQKTDTMQLPERRMVHGWHQGLFVSPYTSFASCAIWNIERSEAAQQVTLGRVAFWCRILVEHFRCCEARL
jgi:hypothetical protein